MVHPPRLGSNLAAHKRVIGVAVATLVGAPNENVLEVVAPGNDQIQLVPIFGSGMSPRYLELWLGLKECL